MITTIILDIGMVLANFCWKEHIETWGLGEEIIDRVGKATVLGPYWGDLDRGVMSDEELKEHCCNLDTEMRPYIERFFQEREFLVEEFDYALDLVKTLKAQGYQVLLLSNYSDLGFSYVKQKFKFYPHVDGGVISYEVKHIKPEPEIYEALIDKYQFDPTKAVFLDDCLPNLEAAKKFGIHTIHFTGLEDAMGKLGQLGIEL